MVNIAAKQKKEEEILKLFSEIQEIQNKESIEYKKNSRKYTHLFGTGHLSVLGKMMYEQRVLKYFIV